MTVATYMKTPITTVEAAIGFIKALDADDKLYHFDDSPETIVDNRTGLPTFTAAECAYLQLRISELFSLDGYDPFDTAVDLINGRD